MLKFVLLLLLTVILLASAGCAASPEQREVKQRSDYTHYGTGGYRMAH